MIIQYLIGSPQGDVPAGPDLLKSPFRITPSENHPTLTLGAYFNAVETFLRTQPIRDLVRTLAESRGMDLQGSTESKAVIRSEKHGALYHISCVEMVAGCHRFKFAVSTAVSDNGRKWLHREFDTLRHLERCFQLPYLPRVYGLGQVLAPGDPHPTEMTMALAEWLEGYSEWHLAVDETDDRQGIRVWETAGHRWASEHEFRQIFRQASKLLTLYYDTQTYCQIYPWHHAAGDFVVKRGPDGDVDVKLTTARKYESVSTMLRQGEMVPSAALLYFLLNLTVRMRLDKQDGVGDAQWAESFSLEAAVEGFLEALALMELEGRYSLGDVREMVSLLKSFTVDEFTTLFLPLLAAYEDEDPADRNLIEAHLKDHIAQLHNIIQRSP